MILSKRKFSDPVPAQKNRKTKKFSREVRRNIEEISQKAEQKEKEMVSEKKTLTNWCVNLGNSTSK